MLSVETVTVLPFCSSFYFTKIGFAFEAILNLFRRVLFTNAASLEITVLFVVISGIEEVCTRASQEPREVWMRRLLGMTPLTHADLLEKRRYWSYTITSSCIIEITCIFVAAAMQIFWFQNNLVFDLGFSSAAGSVVFDQVITSVLIQVLIEVFVDVLCAYVEEKQGLPTSDFFFNFRNIDIFIIHLLCFLIPVHWILQTFKTIPSSYMCMDQSDPCSCNFQVYNLDVCPQLKNMTSPQVEAMFPVTFVEDTGDIIKGVIVAGSICGIVLVTVVARMLMKRDLPPEEMKVDVEKEKNKILLDVVTQNMMAKSSLQQSINAIETIIRGAPPSQQKLLLQVLKLMRQPTSRDTVDVESVLRESSRDPGVVKWLKSQLMNQEEYAMSKAGANNNISQYGDTAAPAFDLNKSFNDNNNVNASEGSDISVLQTTKEGDDDFDLNSLRAGNGINEIFIKAKDQNLLKSILSWDFSIFDVTSDNPSATVAWYIFHATGIINKLKFPKDKLQNFLLVVEQNYSMRDYDNHPGYVQFCERSNNSVEDRPENFYHNKLHGADVMQASLYLASKYIDIHFDFTCLDLFSLLFAAYVHDFNHPGLNGTYVIADWPKSVITSTFGTEVSNLLTYLCMTVTHPHLSVSVPVTS